MAWHTQYGKAEAPDGLLTTVPKTAVPAGGRIEIEPEYKVIWGEIRNTSAVELRVAHSWAALQAGVFYTVAANGAQVISAVETMRRLVIGAPSGGGAGEVEVKLSYSRQPMLDAHPEVTVALGFPAYDGTDPLAIVPGVGT